MFSLLFPNALFLQSGSFYRNFRNNICFGETTFVSWPELSCSSGKSTTEEQAHLLHVVVVSEFDYKNTSFGYAFKKKKTDIH